MRLSWWMAAAAIALGAWWGASVGGDWDARRAYGAYPELLTADAALGRRMSEWLASDERGDSARPDAGVPPDAAGLAVLRDLCDRHARGEAAISTPRDPWRDEKKEPEACWLRDHPSAAADAVLVRLLRDRKATSAVRLRAVIALARPECPAGRDAIVDFVCDPSEFTFHREDALARFSRLASPPPRRMRELLASPWGFVPEAAAAALSVSGDAEAPSLVVDGLEAGAAAYWDRSGWCCCNALARLVEDDAELRARLVDRAAEFAGEKPPTEDETSPEERDEKRRVATLRLVADVRAWLAAHPRLLDTDFERARRAYEDGPQRRRERDTPPAVDVTGDDFDLAAALFRGRDPVVSIDPLARLDRVARLVRADAGPGATPARWIEAMNRRIFGFSPEEQGAGANQSELAPSMQYAMGNCMAFSSIYLAVAERLDLPVHGVCAPGHVFVRWDDGTFRRNIECTEGGVAHDDRWYETRGDGLSIDPADVASGAYLANLRKSEFLALALTNRAFHLARRDEPEAAVAAADAAVRLSPREPAAFIARAYAASVRGSAARAEVLRDLAAALELRRPDLHEVHGAVEACRRVGADAERVAWADRGLSRLPGDAALLVARAGALIRTGRVDEAERDVERIAAGDSNSAVAARLRAEALLVRGGDWEQALRLGFADDADREEACLDLAELALDGCPARAASAADARRALECARAAASYELSVREFEAAGGSSVGLMPFVTRHLARDRNRDRWFALVARCCRAEGDEAGAAAAEAQARGE